MNIGGSPIGVKRALSIFQGGDQIRARLAMRSMGNYALALSTPISVQAMSLPLSQLMGA